MRVSIKYIYLFDIRVACPFAPLPATYLPGILCMDFLDAPLGGASSAARAGASHACQPPTRAQPRLHHAISSSPKSRWCKAWAETVGLVLVVLADVDPCVC